MAEAAVASVIVLVFLAPDSQGAEYGCKFTSADKVSLTSWVEVIQDAESGSYLRRAMAA